MNMEIQAIIPAAVAVISIILFTPKTRMLCYTTVVLCVLAELIPTHLDKSALTFSLLCLISLFLCEGVWAYLDRKEQAYPQPEQNNSLVSLVSKQPLV